MVSLTPMSRDRYPMRESPAEHPTDGPVASATHSTRIPASTLIASNDVATSMMDGPGGSADTQDVIDEAVACRLAVAKRRPQLAA